MLCQKCGQRPATVFFSQTVGNETTQAHLCEECAREQGPSFGVWSALNFHPLAALTGLIHQMLPWGNPDTPAGGVDSGGPAFPNPDTQLQCPHCGYQLSTFRLNGRLGCTRCYEAFAPVMENLITSIHGHARHLEEFAVESQAPDLLEVAASSDHNQPGDPIVRMRNDMKLAIKKEKFEEAARLRDEIKKLESE